MNNYYRFGEALDCDKWWQNLKWCVYYQLKSTEKQMVLLFSVEVNIFFKKEALEIKRKQEESKVAEYTKSIWELRTSPPLDFPPKLNKTI